MSCHFREGWDVLISHLLEPKFFEKKVFIMKRANPVLRDATVFRNSPRRLRRLLAVLCAGILPGLSAHAEILTQFDYYWKTGNNGTWATGLGGWGKVWWHCEVQEDVTPPIQHCWHMFEDNQTVNNGNIYFARYNSTLYPRRYDVHVGKDAQGRFPQIYHFEINNSKNGGNYTFQPATGLNQAAIQAGNSNATYSQSNISIHGSTSNNRYTATFDHVDLVGNGDRGWFGSFQMNDYDSVVFKSSSVEVRGNPIRLNDHTTFSWDGAQGNRTAFPTLKADGIMGAANTVLNLTVPDGYTPSLRGNLPKIYGSEKNSAFTVHLNGGNSEVTAPLITDARVYVDSGKWRFIDSPLRTTFTINGTSNGTFMYADKGLSVNGLSLNKGGGSATLAIAGTLSTPTLSGNGEISLSGGLTLSGAKDQGKGVSSFDGFTGTFTLNNHSLILPDTLAFGHTSTIAGEGQVSFTTSARNSITTQFSGTNGANQPLDLYTFGQPLTLANSTGNGFHLRKGGDGELILSGGAYDYSYRIDAMSGKLTLTNGVGLKTSTLNLTGVNLNVTGQATLTGNLQASSHLIIDGGNLHVTGNATFDRNGVLDYRGGLLTVNGTLTLGGSSIGYPKFVADLPHPGVFVVANYGHLANFSGFSNIGDQASLKNAVTINGKPVIDPILFQMVTPGNTTQTNDSIRLIAPSDYAILYRTSAVDGIWRNDTTLNWQELNNAPAAWQNGTSHIAVFDTALNKDVTISGQVTANMLSFLEGGWSIKTNTTSDALTLLPFAPDPTSSYHFAVLNSQAPSTGNPLDAPRLALPILLSDPSVPLWKTGSGDLVLAYDHLVSQGVHGYSPAQVFIKDGRLILEHPSALGSGMVPGQTIRIDPDTALVLDFSTTYGGHLDSALSGAGALELWNHATLTQANPLFTGSVLVQDGWQLGLADRQAAGNAPNGEPIRLGTGSSVLLDYTDSANALPRAITGAGAVSVMGNRNVRLAAGNSYSGGTILGNNATLVLEGTGAGNPFTAAGSWGIELGASAELNLLFGGILRNELLAPTTGKLTLDANAYTLEDNNVRSDSNNLAGTVDIASGGSLTLSADSAKGGADVRPPFSITGAGDLILDGANVEFSRLDTGGKTSGFTGKTTVADHTTLLLGLDGGIINYGQSGSNTEINLLGADSRLHLIMPSPLETVLNNSLTGIGRVDLDYGSYQLRGNNALFAGVIDIGDSVLNLYNASDVGSARLDLDGGYLQFLASMTLDNTIALNSGGGTVASGGNDMTLSGSIIEGNAPGGSLTKMGNGVLTLTHPDSDYSGETLVSGGTLRLEGGGLTNTSQVQVTAATLSGYGRIAGSTSINGKLSADGQFIFEKDLSFPYAGVLEFHHGGWLDVAGNLNWGSTLVTDIYLDSLGVYKLAQYGATNLTPGALSATYFVNYDGNDITQSPFSSNYRLELVNYSAQNEVILIALPIGQTVEFWNGSKGGIWDVDNTTNWNSQYDGSGSPKTWASESAPGAGDASRIAVFGTSTATPGNVQVQGTVDASGLFFLKSAWDSEGNETGWNITSNSTAPGIIQLLNLSAANPYAVISAQEGNVHINAPLTDGIPGVGLDKTGAATVVLGVANRYTGNTQVSAGTLALGNIAAAGLGSNIEVKDGATLRLAYDNSTTALPQTVTGAGALEITGNALLDKPNTHLGGTRIIGGQTQTPVCNPPGTCNFDLLQGRLHLTDADALGTGKLFFHSGLLTLADSLNVTNEIELEGIANLVSVADGASATLSGAMRGNGLDKIGAGILTLTGNNTFTGNLRLDQGKVVAGSDTALGQGTVRMANNTTLAFSGIRALANDFNLNGIARFEATSTDYATLTGILYGAGDLTKIGDGTLTLTGANAYTGLTDVREGTLAGAITPATDLTVAAGATYDGTDAARSVNALNGGGVIRNDYGLSAQSGTFSGVISGLGSLSKTGAETLTLSGANLYTGDTTVNAGTLEITGTLGAGSYAGAIQNYDTLIFNQADDQTLSGEISGVGSLTKKATGTLTLTSANTFTGALILEGGTLDLGTTGSLATQRLTLNAGTTFDYSNAAYNAAFTTLNVYGTNGGTGANIRTNGTVNLSNSALNFWLSDSTQAGNTLLAIEGSADIDGSTVTVGIPGNATGPNLANKQIVLIDASAGFNSTKPANLNSTLYVKRGATSVTVFDGVLSMDSPGSNERLLLGLTDPPPYCTLYPQDPICNPTPPPFCVTNPNDPSCQPQPPVDPCLADPTAPGCQPQPPVDPCIANPNAPGCTPQPPQPPQPPTPLLPETKALAEGYLAGMILLNRSLNAVSGEGMREALRMGRMNHLSGNRSPFAVLSAGTGKYKTGSHVEMDSVSFIAGLSANQVSNTGEANFGAFVEAGNGSYDTYNKFASTGTLKGNGKIRYWGGGLLGRLDFAESADGNFYVEGSLRAGRVKNEYHSDLRDGLGNRAKFKTSAPYASVHLGGGYRWKLNETAALDLYGQAFYTREDGDKVRLSTGESMKFSGVNSNRLRFGGRYEWILERVTPYVGIAYEHEFDGKARATIDGSRVDVPDLKGGTGIVELGFIMKPAQNHPFTINLGIQGYVGKQEGVTGSLRVKYEF